MSIKMRKYVGVGQFDPTNPFNTLTHWQNLETYINPFTVILINPKVKFCCCGRENPQVHDIGIYEAKTEVLLTREKMPTKLQKQADVFTQSDWEKLYDELAVASSQYVQRASQCPLLCPFTMLCQAANMNTYQREARERIQYSVRSLNKDKKGKLFYVSMQRVPSGWIIKFDFSGTQQQNLFLSKIHNIQQYQPAEDEDGDICAEQIWQIQQSYVNPMQGLYQQSAYHNLMFVPNNMNDMQYQNQANQMYQQQPYQGNQQQPIMQNQQQQNQK